VRKMEIDGAVAIVTGANRGIGRAFVERLLARGAARIYAATRDPAAHGDLAARDRSRVVPLTLDVTDPTAVTRAAGLARDVNLLVNNAGVMSLGGFLEAPSLDPARAEMETNYFGALAMIRAFAPILSGNGGGAVVNLLSIAAHVNIPSVASYSASKAAAWSMTQAVRAELVAQGTQVVAVFPGPVDTDMAVSLPGAKALPADVVDRMLDAVRDGVEDVYPDAYAQKLKQRLDLDAKAVEKKLAVLAGSIPGR
jgi:NAD(P)-dependent dehydrogenase (short-subunit alcohol dehydrogenase family)